jgi:hypothetical protein
MDACPRERRSSSARRRSPDAEQRLGHLDGCRAARRSSRVARRSASASHPPARRAPLARGWTCVMPMTVRLSSSKVPRWQRTIRTRCCALMATSTCSCPVLRPSGSAHCSPTASSRSVTRGCTRTSIMNDRWRRPDCHSMSSCTRCPSGRMDFLARERRCCSRRRCPLRSAWTASALDRAHHALVLTAHSWAHRLLRRVGELVDVAAMSDGLGPTELHPRRALRAAQDLGRVRRGCWRAARRPSHDLAAPHLGTSPSRRAGMHRARVACRTLAERVLGAAC